MIIGNDPSWWLLMTSACLLAFTIAAAWFLIWNFRRSMAAVRTYPFKHFARPMHVIGSHLLVTTVPIATLLTALAFILTVCVRQAPALASQPWLGQIVRWIASQDDLQRSLDKGIALGDGTLVGVSLALGANPGNAEGAHSYLILAPNEDIRQRLLAHGAPVDGIPPQPPPLREAWRRSDEALFNALLAAGANPDRAIHAGDHLLVKAILRQRDSARWVQPLIDHGADLNQRTANGISVLDEIVLGGAGPEWPQRLRAAGARHALLLDGGTALPDDHPVLLHVHQWLEARRSADIAVRWGGQPSALDQWELPDAHRQGAGYLALSKPLRRMEGRVDGDEASVRLHFRAPLESPQATLVSLRRVRAEAAGDVAADVWRVAGYWPDRRP
ncbi:MAG: hypothetical protein KDI51_02355 [Xanthomonadales bacterium]|nr:hypothetical protein [Xanthomonadales bacterium]MCB1633399.1 hypothetical protein [Xanthomonadales bacterium]